MRCTSHATRLRPEKGWRDLQCAKMALTLLVSLALPRALAVPGPRAAEPEVAKPGAAEPQAGGPGSWKVGLSRNVITPKKAIWLSGYAARKRPADGKIHDLWVKALTLEARSGQRAVVVTSDLLGFPKHLSDAICLELRENHGLERSQILLSSTHTHSGPVLSRTLVPCYPLDDEQRKLIDQYSQWLVGRVVETVAAALEVLQPAELHCGEGETTFAVNRRNNRESEVPKLLAQGTPLKGPVEHSVPVLAVRAPEGRLLALVFGYACHNTNLDGYQWCGDYAGFAQLALEESHPGAAAMFWAGCGADQNPLPRRSLELCEKYGKMLASAVEEVLKQPMRRVAPELRTAFDLVTLDFADPLTRPELEAMRDSENVLSQRWGRQFLRELEAGNTLQTSYPYPVQVWRLGASSPPQLWIILGGEVVVDFSLRFKKSFGDTTWITAYSNDVMAYIPSRRIQEEGGYEAGAMHVYGLPAKGWASDVEERVAGKVERLVGEVTPAGVLKDETR